MNVHDKDKAAVERNKTMVKKEEANLVHYAEELFDDVNNMDGVENARLPQIRILHQGQTFELPDEENQLVKNFEGIIIDTNRTNVYWEKDLAEGGAGNMPDCFSFNAIVPAGGESQVNDDCPSCPMNKFKSDGGRGKKCKNQRRVHILLDGDDIPCRLSLPPTSLRNFDEYMVTLQRKKIKYPFVVTKFSLEKAENKDNIAYSRVKFEMVKRIEDIELLKNIAGLRKKLMEQMKYEAITVDEVMPEGENGDPF